VDLRPGSLNKYSLLRQHHRLALPFLAQSVDAQRIDGGVLVASSTGWAHGYTGADHTVVYCHAPARWLYQTQRYLGSHAGPGMRGQARQMASRVAMAGLMAPLRRWDNKKAQAVDVYLANSTVTKRAIAEVYGIDAEVLAPPPALLPGGPERAVANTSPGFLLCVARLLPYKNVDVIIEAVNNLPDVELVVVGAGPDWERLQQLAGPRVKLLGRVDDDELRWLYRNCSALAAASYEDYGLSPLEAGAFGRPSVVLRDGGFLDTVVDGVNGVLFDSPTPGAIADSIREVLAWSWDSGRIVDHVDLFSADRFVSRLHEVVGRFAPMPVSIPAQSGPRELQDAGQLVA
jgi:glycosyltransferase involved in cell wall biosynthesis